MRLSLTCNRNFEFAELSKRNSKNDISIRRSSRPRVVRDVHRPLRRRLQRTPLVSHAGMVPSGSALNAQTADDGRNGRTTTQSRRWPPPGRPHTHPNTSAAGPNHAPEVGSWRACGPRGPAGSRGGRGGRWFSPETAECVCLIHGIRAIAAPDLPVTNSQLPRLLL